MTLDALISQHADDFEGLELFTAYTAAAPFHRVGVSMLVQEASPVDPIDLFVLKGIRNGRTSPTLLAEFFGLDEHDIDVSLAAMLHDSWIRADPAGQRTSLEILPTGHKVLEEEIAYSQQVRDAEVWVNATSGELELKVPQRRRLLQGKDARARNLFLLRDRLPKPQSSSDLIFEDLQAAVTKFGTLAWPSTKLTVVLDILGVTRKSIGYREVDVLVFQSRDGRKVEFEVFDAGVRSTAMESGLRRLEEEKAEVVPIVELPPAEDIEAFHRQATWVEAIRASETGLDHSKDQLDTRDRLRDELARAEGTIRDLKQRQDLQRVARNGENREVWIDVLTRVAQRYVVMEFPWITREALDDEIIGLMQAAMRRGVNLWLSWGLNKKDGPDRGDPAVLEKLRVMERRRDPGRLTVRYRGDTHRKLLLWDSDLALVGSFNFGSFRGDPRKPVRQEMCVFVSSPDAVHDLEAEFQTLFDMDELGPARK